MVPAVGGAPEEDEGGLVEQEAVHPPHHIQQGEDVAVRVQLGDLQTVVGGAEVRL